MKGWIFKNPPFHFLDIRQQTQVIRMAKTANYLSHFG